MPVWTEAVKVSSKFKTPVYSKYQRHINPSLRLFEKLSKM